MTSAKLSAQVECGRDFKAENGTLTLSQGQLRFDTQNGVAFDLPVTAIGKIVWHWYSFSAAFEATIDGKSYFLSFMPRRPSLAAWFEGMATGRKWRAVLEGRPLFTVASIYFKILMLAFWLARLLLMAVSLLFALTTATDSATELPYRILAGFMAVLLVGYLVLFIILGVQSLRSPEKK